MNEATQAQAQLHDIQQPVAITLPRGAWELVKQIIKQANVPWNTSDPLLRALEAQLTDARQPSNDTRDVA